MAPDAEVTAFLIFPAEFVGTELGMGSKNHMSGNANNQALEDGVNHRQRLS